MLLADKIFISFTSSDLAYATALCKKFSESNIKNYFSDRDVGFNDNIVTWINSSLKESNVFIGICSKNYLEEARTFVEQERDYATMKAYNDRDYEIILIEVEPIRFDSVPPLLANKPRLSFHNLTPNEFAIHAFQSVKSRNRPTHINSAAKTPVNSYAVERVEDIARPVVGMEQTFSAVNFEYSSSFWGNSDGE